MAAPAQPVDLSVAMRYLGGDRRLLLELVGIFLDDGPKRLDSLRVAMSASDNRQIEQVAHSLRGSAAILGATDLQSAAVALEDAAHDGHAEHGPQMIARIARELERAIAFFADPGWPTRLDAEATP